MAYTYFLPQRKPNGHYKLLDINGNDVKKQYQEKGLHHYHLRDGVKQEKAIRYDEAGNSFRKVDNSFYFDRARSRPTSELEQPLETETQKTHDEIVQFIQESAVGLKPDMLLMEELTWKYLVRSVIRSQNVLMTGPTGSGKTMTVKWLAEALNRPLFVFNLGSTQDSRSTLIGNTHFNKESGTYFTQSEFIRAIQTENAVVLLDEVSRANPEAFNILMSILDKNQRYVRLDEDEATPLIRVHPTVTFIGTANIGVEYSSTRVIDRALLDRFVTINMNYLDYQGEKTLLSKLFSNMDEEKIEQVAKIVSLLRDDARSEDANTSNTLSTRHSIEIASLINDGFTLEEAAELVIYPQYDDDGGIDSERTYVRQLIQSQFTSTMDEANTTTDDEKELFNSVVF